MDTQIFFLINGHHTVFLDHFMYLVTMKAVWLPLYISLLYIVLRNYSWKGALAILLMIGAGMLVTDWANAHWLRPWIGRLRPSNPDNPISHMVHIVNGKRGSGCGFPSAHAANIWLLTLLMARHFRTALVSRTIIIIALLVCYSRIYLGYHYPGDVLGGFVLAYLTYAVMMWINEVYINVGTRGEVHGAKIVAAVGYGTIAAFAVLALAHTTGWL